MIEDAKLEVFVEAEPVVCGLELRPFTAGSLIILKKTGNGLLKGDDTNTEFDVAAFLYAHTANVKIVRRAARNKEIWEEMVLAFADKLTVRDFVKAANQIQGIMESAMIGQDYEVETKDGGGADPN